MARPPDPAERRSRIEVRLAVLSTLTASVLCLVLLLQGEDDPNPTKANSKPLAQVEPARVHARDPDRQPDKSPNSQHIPARNPSPAGTKTPAAQSNDADDDPPLRDLEINDEVAVLYAPMASHCVRVARIRDPNLDQRYSVTLDIMGGPGRDTRVLDVSIEAPGAEPDAQLIDCIEKTAAIVDLPEIDRHGREHLSLQITAD